MTTTSTTRDYEPHRRALTGFCYRMLGSAAEADDAVQETLIRAWRHGDGFEGRAAFKTWLFRIATNVCIDAINGRKRRARPMELSPVGHARVVLTAPSAEDTWVTPINDVAIIDDDHDPAQALLHRESVRLAFVAALQHLPAKQRAVLILRDVLSFSANEVAELLETTVASANSALQRARATLAEKPIAASDVRNTLDAAQQALLDAYLAAFERYDIAALAKLLHEDAVLSMPPWPLWLQGHGDISAWMLGTGIGCVGSKLVPVVASGSPAFAQYRKAEDGNGHMAWSIIVLELNDGLIAGVNNFLDVERLFPRFGLPMRLLA
ncbi:MAG TPA: sigma-70 family RNA polymerase sigma factor [Myxococcota bacterium]